MKIKFQLINKKLRGFTLVETLVAISILMLAVTGPLYFAAESLKAATYAKDQITAFYLAQDAFEQIREIRSSNITKSSSWLTGISGVCDSLCKIDPHVTTTPVACVGNCGAIKRTDDGKYGYGYTSNGWNDTPFNRSIKVETTENETVDGVTSPTEVKVTVTITWKSGTIDRVFTAYEFLRNVN